MQPARKQRKTGTYSSIVQVDHRCCVMPMVRYVSARPRTIILLDYECTRNRHCVNPFSGCVQDLERLDLVLPEDREALSKHVREFVDLHVRDMNLVTVSTG